MTAIQLCRIRCPCAWSLLTLSRCHVSIIIHIRWVVRLPWRPRRSSSHGSDWIRSHNLVIRGPTPYHCAISTYGYLDSDSPTDFNLHVSIPFSHGSHLLFTARIVLLRLQLPLHRKRPFQLQERLWQQSMTSLGHRPRYTLATFKSYFILYRYGTCCHPGCAPLCVYRFFVDRWSFVLAAGFEGYLRL